MLLAADYSQIELRVLAHITGDEALTEVFATGKTCIPQPPAGSSASRRISVTRDMRRMAKVVNFSIPYGTTAFGLAQQLGVPRQIRRRTDADLPQHASPVSRAIWRRLSPQARRDGYVTTLLGRRRPLPDLHAAMPTIRQAAERTAINTPIQGTAADIMKLAMLRV